MTPQQKLDAIRELADTDKTFVLAKKIREILDTPDYYESTIPIGSHIILYEGMGEHSLGVLLDTDKATSLVKLDGYIEPSGQRWEPYSMWVQSSSVAYDPDPVASAKADQERMLKGYKRIEAKYGK